MSRDNSAQRMTTSPHEQALLLDGVAGRPAVAHNGWPNGQKTVDAETLSGNCCCCATLRRVAICWLDICRNEPTVAPHATLQIDKVIGLSDCTDALGDLLSLGAERAQTSWRAGLRVLCELLQAYGRLGGDLGRAGEARRPYPAVALACAQAALAPYWPPWPPPAAWWPWDRRRL